MMYCDGVHLISDISIADLHEKAKAIGIKRCWYHASSNYPHYDLPKKLRNDWYWMVSKNIRRVDPREIPVILRKAGLVKK